MTITFYVNFEKRVNSTKRPTVGGLVEAFEVDGFLRENCSMMHPIIGLKETPVTGGNIPAVLTYAYIPRFGRYYFVRDWQWKEGLWEVTMDVDVLATYKPHIGGTTCYVERSSNLFDGAVIDTKYPATTNFNLSSTPLSNPFVETLSQGTYVVGIISNSADSVGAITYFAMTQAEFGLLKSTLFSDSNLEIMNIIDSGGQTIIQDVSAEMFKALYNPYQYITSCFWFPILKSQMPGTEQTGINIGWWGYQRLTGRRLTSQTMSLYDGAVVVPVHPQAASRGKYLNYAPYTHLTLQGKFGTLPINTSYLEIGSYLIPIYTIDLITGETICEVYIATDSSGTGRVLVTKTSFMVGTQIQLAQVGINYLGTAANFVSALPAMAAGALSSGLSSSVPAMLTSGATGAGLASAVSGAMNGAASGIYNAITTAMPQVHVSAGNGSFAMAAISTVLIAQHFIITEEDNAEYGRPLCRKKQISDIPGFIKCGEAQVDFYAYEPELEAIHSFMLGGFFYE